MLKEIKVSYYPQVSIPVVLQWKKLGGINLKTPVSPSTLKLAWYMIFGIIEQHFHFQPQFSHQEME